MIEQDELTGFVYRIFDTDADGEPMPMGEKRIVSTGYYRGVKVMQMSIVTDEFIEDAAVDVGVYLKRSLTEWGRENWPPIDSHPQTVLE